MIMVPLSASALNPNACNCVIFRFDDVQDYFVNSPQIAVMDKFIEKNEDVSLGIIMNFIGNDASVVTKVQQGHATGRFELSVHGWNHDDYTTLSAQTQKDTLKLASDKMKSIWGKNSTTFILPYNSYNTNTLQAMKDLGFKIISSEFDQELNSGDIYVAISPLDIKDSFGIYHLPQVIEYYSSATNTKTPLNTIMSTVDTTIATYGYAVVTLHPTDFAAKDLSHNPTNAVNATEIASLDSLIGLVHSSGYTIKTFNSVTNTSIPPLQDNTAPVITLPADVAQISPNTLTIISALGTATATDNFDPSPVITNNATSQIANGFPQGTTKVKWTATDNFGNSASAIQYVTVRPSPDTTFPQVAITAPLPNAVINGPAAGINIRINGTASDVPSGVKVVEVNTNLVPNIAATPNSPDWSTWTYIVHVDPIISQGPRNSTSAVASGPDENWSNVNNIFTSNNGYATVLVDGTKSDPLQATGFGFTIPQNSFIEGITVDIERKSSSISDGGSKDFSVKLLKGGTATGSDKATSTIYTISDVIESHGSSVDLWGTTWIPADINAANFGVALSVTKPNAVGNAHTVSIDQIRITVHYRPGPPLTDIDTRVTDFWGNVGFSAIGSQSITVNLSGPDTTPPELIPPPNISMNATGTLTPVSLGTPKVFDNSDITPSISNSVGPGESSGFPLGTTIVTWTATDHAVPPNSSTAIQSITITDTPPAITLVTPISGTSVNSNFLANYTLSKVISSGNFTFTRTSGTTDVPPHFYNFTTLDKTIGAHSVNSTGRTIGLFGNLVDGAVYTMKISAKDVVLSTSFNSTGIIYDTTAPGITLVTPISGTSVNSNFLANYTLSETTSSGNFTFTRTGGTPDILPHIYNFAIDDKTIGLHSISRATLETGFGNSLVDGAVYTMKISAKDAASNSNAVSNTGITYLATAPVISSVTPAPNAFINSITTSSAVSYTLSGNIASGSIVFTRTGGTDDGASPHTCTLKGTALNSGVHTNLNLADTTNTCTVAQSLVSGTVYTMTISAIDEALNEATPVTNNLILYDDTAPVISSVTPALNSSINGLFTANYTLSEPVASGTITFVRTGGTPDPDTYIYNFATSDKTSNAHSISRSLLEAGFGNSLVNGAIYTMTISATDVVSNVSIPVINTGITFDTTNPVISLVIPITSSSVNQFNVAYTLSESASSGAITFTRTGGTPDILPHIYNFAIDDKTPGPHAISKTTLFGSSLVNGAVYTMTVSAIDLASNVATPVSKTSITYSNPPGICPAPTIPWTIESGCRITSNVNPLGNVDVQNGAIVTIESTGTLNIDSLTKYLKIHFGSGILIKSGGKIN
jgi:peptidoglycan/xylan/chitin deacetylase (PgdA/CDA1 family)